MIANIADHHHVCSALQVAAHQDCGNPPISIIRTDWFLLNFQTNLQYYILYTVLYYWFLLLLF